MPTTWKNEEQLVKLSNESNESIKDNNESYISELDINDIS